MANLGSLVYYIKSKNQDFKRGMRENKKEIRNLDRQAKKSQSTLQKYSQSFKKAGMALTAFGAIVTGVSFKLTKMASDANEIQSRFDHVFGELSQDANEWAENFSESFGQSRSEIKSMMAELQDTLVPMGLAEEKAYKLNKQVTQLAIDMSSFANVPLEQAMSDITSGIVGMSRPMRKYGSILTQTRVKQYALKTGIIETDRELTEQEKILARIQLMLQDMEKATGDYKRTQDSFANQLRETRKTLKNIGETLGKFMLPAFTDLLEKVKGLLEWFEDLPDSTKRVIAKFTVFSGLIAGIVGPLALIVGYLPQIASGFNMIYGAMSPHFLVGGAIILGLTAIYKLIKDIRKETDLLTTATEELTEAQLKEKKVMLENKISRLEDLVERGGEEDSILGPGLSTDLAERRLKNYREQLIKTEEALSEFKETAGGPPPLGEGGDGTSERPGWLGPGPEPPEVDEEKAKQIAQRIMDMGYETRIAQMEGLQKELMQLRLSKKRELEAIGEYGIPEEEMSIQGLSILEKYEAKRENIFERYAKLRKQKQDEIMRNQFRLQEISKEEYREYLQDRLDDLEHASNEYMNVWNELQSLKEEKAEEQDYTLPAPGIEMPSDAELGRMFPITPPGEMGINKIKKNYKESLNFLKRQNKWFGDSMDFAAEKAELLKDMILKILKLPSTKAGLNQGIIREYIEMWRELTGEEPAELNNMEQMFKNIGYAVDEAQKNFERFRDGLIDGITQAIVKGKGLADVFKNIADMFASMVLKKAIVQPFVDWGLGKLGLSEGHRGGLVTTAGIIPEMHGGGLAMDEIPAILQTGERVLSRKENKAYESGGGTTNILIQAVDSKSFQQMLAENRATVTQLSVEDIMKNGQLRKALKQYL